MRTRTIAGAVILCGLIGELQAQAPSSSQYMTTQRFDDYLRAHQQEHALEAQALQVARQTVDQRLTEMNNLRTQITSERGMFITRAEHDTLRADMQVADARSRDDIGKVNQELASLRATNTTWTIALGVFFTMTQIGIQFVSHFSSLFSPPPPRRRNEPKE